MTTASATNANPIETSADGEEFSHRQLPARFWQILHHPLLLIGVAGLILILLLVTKVLPQLPGQLIDAPAERMRWLLSAQEAYGSSGPLLAGLGLFDFVHSFVLRFLLALLTLQLLVHLGSLVGTWQRHRRLDDLLRHRARFSGDPLPIPGFGQIYRRRLPLAMEPEQSVHWLRQQIARILPARDIKTATTPLSLAEKEQADGAQSDPISSALEARLLVVDSLPFLYLRLLSVVGLILALAVVWLNIIYGWEVRPPALIPGNQFRLPQRDLLLSYDMAPPEDSGTDLQPALTMHLNEVENSLPVDAGLATRRQIRLGTVGIWVQAATPTLIIESWQVEDKIAALALPGHTQLVGRLAFAFPTVRSEESVLIPEAQVGLRIVRLPEENRFSIEIIDGVSGQEIERTEITADGAVSVAIPTNTDEYPLALRFNSLPSLDIHVRYLPGETLFWLALLPALAGLLGFFRRPRLLLCQLAPWPVDRTVLVVQSDDGRVAEAICAAVEAEARPLETERSHIP